QKKAFTEKNRDRLAELLLTRFKEAAGVKEEAEKKKIYDKALREAVEFVRKTLADNLGRASAAPAPGVASGRSAGKPAVPVAPTEEGGVALCGVWGGRCLAGVVLLVIWVVMALVRAFTGAGRGYQGGPAGVGPGGPGYGYGGGGGGGGFMS